MSTAWIGVSAAIAAAKKKREESEEEAIMYKPEDMDGWEFKIVRSTWGKFSNREYLERIRKEEAQAGWELVEKFDQHRVRFKRRIDARSNDHLLDFDPYRTSMSGGGSSSVVWWIAGLLLLAGLLVFGLFLMPDILME